MRAEFYSIYKQILDDLLSSEIGFDELLHIHCNDQYIWDICKDLINKYKYTVKYPNCILSRDYAVVTFNTQNRNEVTFFVYDKYISELKEIITK